MAQYVETVATPAITAGSAYSAGQAIGGLITFGNVTRQLAAQLRTLVLVDASNQKAAIDLLLFNQSFTPTADKAALAISPADALNLVGRISILGTNYTTIGTGAEATINGLIFPVLSSGGQTSLFGQLVSRGTPTYATTSALQLRVTFERYVNNMF